MREFVFDTKGSKKIKKFIPAFIVFTLLYAGIASLLVLGTGEVTTVKVVGLVVCILAVLAIFGSIVLGVGKTNTKIKISDKGVDVKKSKNEGHYALEDYVEAMIIEKKGRRGTVTRIPTLVFEVDDEEYLIDCTGFSTADFTKITDIIRILIHVASEEREPKEEMSGSTYEGDYVYRPVKGIGLVIGFFAFSLLALITVDIWFIMQSGFDNTTIALTLMIALATIGCVVFFAILRSLTKKKAASVIKKLVIDTFELKVNGDVRDYRKINTIYMTAPYLKDVDGWHRMLKVKTADDPKPLEYTVMKRPEKTILSDDDYSRLYNSIRKMCEVQGIAFDPYGTEF